MAENSVLFFEHDHTIIYNGKEAVLEREKKHAELFSAVAVPLKYLHSFSYKISKNIGDDELVLKTELKMYKEGGLDAEKEYRIDFVKYDVGDEYLIEAFALEKEDFDNYLADFSYKIDVVDLAFPRFLAYEARYETQEKKSNDLYIYISDDEAFGAIYQNGKYIGHRIINSLQAISKRTGLELVKLKEYLKEKGLKRDNYGLEETLILDTIVEVFSKDIEKIVYSVNHKRGLFGLDGIDSIFIDFDGNNLEGIKDFFLQYGFEPTIEPLKQQIQELSPSLSVLLDYVFKLHNGRELDVVNVTHRERKKPLWEYLGFRYFLEVVVIVLFLVGIGIFVSYYLRMQQDKISQLNPQVKEKKRKVKELTARMKKLQKKNSSLLKEKKSLEDQIFVYETTFRVIPMIGQMSTKRQQMMNDILRVLKKYQLNASSLLQKDAKSVAITLISQSNRRADISRFMHDLIQMGYKDVTTRDIIYENGIYKSKITIGLEKN